MSSVKKRVSNVIAWISAAFLTGGILGLAVGAFQFIIGYYDWNDSVGIGAVLLIPWLLLGIIHYIWTGSFRLAPWRAKTSEAEV